MRFWRSHTITEGCSVLDEGSETLLRAIGLVYSRDQDDTALVYPSVLHIGSRENSMSQISLLSIRSGQEPPAPGWRSSRPEVWAERDCSLRTGGVGATRVCFRLNRRASGELSAGTPGDGGLRRWRGFLPSAAAACAACDRCGGWRILQLLQGVSAASLPWAACKQTCTPMRVVEHVSL